MKSDTLAERLIDSDMIAPRNQRAILSAFQRAGSDRVQPEHFTAAAKEHRAAVRIVAAGCGWGRCWHCGEWRDIGEELPDDPASCPCTLELEDDDVFHAFTLYVYAGGPVVASLVIPASVTERIRKYVVDGGDQSATNAAHPLKGG